MKSNFIRVGIILLAVGLVLLAISFNRLYSIVGCTNNCTTIERVSSMIFVGKAIGLAGLALVVIGVFQRRKPGSHE